MKFLADENIPQRIIIFLKQSGYDVLDFKKEYSSEPDKKVIQLAHQEQRIILTLDKDFLQPIDSEQSPSIVVFHFPKEKTDTILKYFEKF